MGSSKGLAADLASRLREVRVEHERQFGDTSLAEDLDLPARTWANYESGVAIPGLQLLRLIDRTGIHPIWLLTGCGNRYLEPPPPRDDSEARKRSNPAIVHRDALRRPGPLDEAEGDDTAD